MVVSPLDNVLFKEMFSTPEMRRIFDEKNFIQKILDVEYALMSAQGELGIVPKEVVEDMGGKVNLDYLDLEEISKTTATTGHFLVATIKSWANKCGESGRYIHWGATTQDIYDTSIVLLVRDAYSLMREDIKCIINHLIDISSEYKNTPMAGRTHIGHAVPITFGYKVAVWLDEMNRHLDRFNEMEERLLTGNITGAAGTFAGLGEHGFEVQDRALKKLGLNVPNICWHAARDRFGEFLNQIALTASSLSKIGQQILILMRPEILEVEEPLAPGFISSSTMPQKRNPALSEWTIGFTKNLRSYANVMNESLETFDERNEATWICEYVIIPESCLYFGLVLSNIKTILEGLIVHPENMYKNIMLSKGLINTENVMMALSVYTGKHEAHHIMSEIATKAWKEDKSLEEVLLENGTIREQLSPEKIKELCDPVNYTGESCKIVERLLNKIKPKEYAVNVR